MVSFYVRKPYALALGVCKVTLFFYAALCWRHIFYDEFSRQFFLRFYEIRAECCLGVRKRVRKRTFLPGKVKTRFQAVVPLREQIKNMSDII